MGEFGIGQSVPRTEDPRLLKGQGQFGDDFSLAGQAVGYFLRSPHAHAEIVDLNVEKARDMPGVLSILTGADLKSMGLGPFPFMVQRQKRDGTIQHGPRQGLALDRARFVGDPIAFVTAETLHQAKDAAEAIEVNFNLLPAFTDLEAAGREGGIPIWDDCPDNEAFYFELGDKTAVDMAFETADHITKIDYRVNRVSANAMEPRVSIGDYDRRTERFLLTTSTQQVHGIRTHLSTVLQVPEARIRVSAGDVGGGFGMKGEMYDDQLLVLLASRAIGRPVRWTADRTESLMSDTHARDNIVSAELALNANGKFLAFRVRTLAALGAYMSMMTAHSPTNNLGGLAGVYTTPAIHVSVSGFFTNNNNTAPYRGAGRPEASLAIEKAIDKAAYELGIDRAELRRRNIIPPKALPYQTGLIFKYDSGRFEESLDKTLRISDWKKFEERRQASQAAGKLRGIGISFAIEQSAAPIEETAEIRFDSKGGCTILLGTVAQGQGHDVTFKQIVNDLLGISLENITLLQADTDIVAHGRGTFGSRSAGNGGGALLMASNRIIEKGKIFAAHMLEAAPEDIEFDNGNFKIGGTDRQLAMVEVAQKAYDLSLPPGIEPTLHAQAAFKPMAPTFPNGCHICEIEVDPETGLIEFHQYVVVDDVGTVVNPLLLKGQIIGGIAQGLGQAICEDVAYDHQNGQLLSASFIDYCMPRADNFCSIEVVSNGDPSPTNPLGIKGAGEAGCVGALPCVQSALIDALRPLGIFDVPMPATPHKIWQLIATNQ
jgi:carbon-monoxide dehydrogenase large subunit